MQLRGSFEKAEVQTTIADRNVGNSTTFPAFETVHLCLPLSHSAAAHLTMLLVENSLYPSLKTIS